ncbi:MAG: diguanylate cyclase [Gammaproteobacteria bacterium]|jgi:diguanylate cyclase
MKYPESSEVAASYLKQAIPKMVTNAIPANPINYTLWYSYVSERNLSLNSKLDHFIASTGTCSAEQSEELYLNYIIEDYLEDNSKSLENLTLLASQLLGHMNIAMDGSAVFDQQLANNITRLSEVKTIENVADVVEDVVRTAQSIKAANNQFNDKIELANKEIQSLRSQLEEVEKQVFVDKLTQLYNRHAFDIQLKQLLEIDTVSTHVCLIIMDIDHFKSFNDEYGHVIGDRVLGRVGELVQDFCPEHAIGARYGGEEFAILISNSNEKQAAELAEGFRLRLEKLRITVKSSSKVLDNITASFGVTRFQLGESSENFIDRADKMLYKAKQSGRNRVEVDFLT